MMDTFILLTVGILLPLFLVWPIVAMFLYYRAAQERDFYFRQVVVLMGQLKVYKDRFGDLMEQE